MPVDTRVDTRVGTRVDTRSGARGGTRGGTRGGGALCAVLLAAAVLTGCGGGSGGGNGGGAQRPVTVAGKQRQSAPLPIPRGTGSKLPTDFNGDGAPDLVLDALAHDGLGDDPGIGVVYGKKGHGPVPDTRQLLSPATYKASTLSSEASCDLDRDGFADLVVSTDPPYDGRGMPPVPLRVLFGSPRGISGEGVTLKIPARARFGNEWPDRPVCGDFDGDGREDLVVHASGGRLSVLPGPFTRAGAPRGTARLAEVGGDVPTGPAADVNGDGADDLLIRAHTGTARSTVALGGRNGFTAGASYPAGTDAAFGRFGAAVLGAGGVTVYGSGGEGEGDGAVRVAGGGDRVHTGDFDGDGKVELAVSSGDADGSGRVRIVESSGAGKARSAPAAGRVVAVADFDGDGGDDLVVQRVSGNGDVVTVLTRARPRPTFSTRAFTP
ncbi:MULTISPECIES: VCBS repeat-containing protein [unclassified Streptomyces]|uniref:FG-GAP repeat domain-containing protein n=1 Tax=unclassified Streptomyces TaxID=2593676 RepID=UPI00278C67C7|nr:MULTISPECIES: VCBS repeat-containing protein [unclassified Streptomyces]